MPDNTVTLLSELILHRYRLQKNQHDRKLSTGKKKLSVLLTSLPSKLVSRRVTPFAFSQHLGKGALQSVLQTNDLLQFSLERSWLLLAVVLRPRLLPQSFEEPLLRSLMLLSRPTLVVLFTILMLVFLLECSLLEVDNEREPRGPCVELLRHSRYLLKCFLKMPLVQYRAMGLTQLLRKDRQKPMILRACHQPLQSPCAVGQQ